MQGMHQPTGSKLRTIYMLSLLALVWAACGEGGEGSASAVGAVEIGSKTIAPEATAMPPVVATLPDASTTWCGQAPCPCEEGSENLHSRAETLQKCRFLEPTLVQGVHCKAGDAYFPACPLWMILSPSNSSPGGQESESR